VIRLALILLVLLVHPVVADHVPDRDPHAWCRNTESYLRWRAESAERAQRRAEADVRELRLIIDRLEQAATQPTTQPTK
jgi:phage terminase Nu1 subunit (DNA packaging protein)